MRLDSSPPSLNVEMAFCSVAPYLPPEAESVLPAYSYSDGAAFTVAAVIMAAVLTMCFAALICDGTEAARRKPPRSRSVTCRASPLH